MKISLIDIGSNLTHESFASDRDAVMSRALAAGVRRQIVTGTDLVSSLEAFGLAAASPSILSSTAGVHPHHAHRVTAAGREEVRDLLRRDEVVAVGECGLDYFRDLSPREARTTCRRNSSRKSGAAPRRSLARRTRCAFRPTRLRAFECPRSWCRAHRLYSPLCRWSS